MFRALGRRAPPRSLVRMTARLQVGAVLFAALSSCTSSSPDWTARMKLPPFVPSPPPLPQPPCPQRLSVEGAADELAEYENFSGVSGWDGYTSGTCAIAFILNSPDPVPTLLKVFHRSRSGGKTYALMGLYLVSMGDFAQVLDGFSVPAGATILRRGCTRVRAEPDEVIGLLLQRHMPEQLAELAREIGATAPAGLRMGAATRTGTAAQQTDEAGETWRR